MADRPRRVMMMRTGSRDPYTLLAEKGPTAMTTTRRIRHAMVALIILTAWGIELHQAWAQSDEVTAVMRIEAPGQPPMDMEYFLGEDRMRLDMSEEMSVISITDSDPSMLMLQHPQQRYIEWNAQQLQMMQQMMGQLPNASGSPSASDFDPTQIQFEETGNTAQVGPWNAFEVLMTSADGEQGALWLTTEADVGLFEITLRAAEAASAFSMPMGGGGGSPAFLQYQSLAQAQGLPEGRCVRIVADDDNGGTTITLLSAEPGSIPASTFEPPAGYQQMQMPSIPGLLQ